MTSYLLSGPAEEPVTLAEAKAWLRVDGDDENALLTTLIAAARLHVESVSGRALISQSWRLVRDGWPDDFVVKLPVTPLLALTAVTATDPDGEAVEVDLDGIDLGRTELLLPAGFAFVATRPRDGVAIDYVAGYGANAADVPKALQQAVLLLAGYWFENRDAVGQAAVPSGFDALIAPYRAVRL